MTLEVALDAMKQDAATWDDVASALTSAGSTAGTLAFPAMTWPQVIDVPLHETYEELRSLVETLLGEGAAQATGVADTLLAVKRDYESTDHAQAAAYRGKWDVIS
jgi:hypothetical protein